MKVKLFADPWIWEWKEKNLEEFYTFG